MLRIHFKEKSSTDLFHELTNLVQTSKDDTSEFILRALSLRQKILFVNEELISCVKYTKDQAQAAFLNVIDNGLQTEAVINKIRPHLADPELSDEDLMDYVT